MNFYFIFCFYLKLYISTKKHRSKEACWIPWGGFSCLFFSSWLQEPLHVTFLPSTAKPTVSAFWCMFCICVCYLYLQPVSVQPWVLTSVFTAVFCSCSQISDKKSWLNSKWSFLQRSVLFVAARVAGSAESHCPQCQHWTILKYSQPDFRVMHAETNNKSESLVLHVNFVLYSISFVSLGCL